MCALLLSAKSKRGSKKAKPKPAATQRVEAAKPAEKWPPLIPLRTNLRFTIRPTLLGLVPPGDPEGFGECFVRVLSTAPLAVHYEIKEQHSEQVGSRTQETTAIRRGDVRAEQSTVQLSPPMLWSNGSWNTASGLLWLSAAQFAELKGSGKCPHDLTLPGGTNSALLAPMNSIVAQRRRAYGLLEHAPPGVIDTHLIVQNWQATYPAYVNGRRADLPCIKCTDSVRLAHYWILDDPLNPLLLKMTYIAPSLAQTDPPLPAAKPADPSTRSEEREQVQLPPAEAADPAEALINSGAGFAVINVDY